MKLSATTIAAAAATSELQALAWLLTRLLNLWALQERFSHDYSGTYPHEHNHLSSDGICTESWPFPQPTSAFRVFPLTYPFGASLGFGELIAAATEDLAGEAFAGTALLGSLLLAYLLSLDCEGIAQWIEHSRLHVPQPKTLATSPGIVKLTHGRIVWGSFDFINHPLQTTNGPKLVEEKLCKHFLVWPLLARNLVQTFIRLDVNSCKSATGYPLKPIER